MQLPPLTCSTRDFASHWHEGVTPQARSDSFVPDDDVFDPRLLPAARSCDLDLWSDQSSLAMTPSPEPPESAPVLPVTTSVEEEEEEVEDGHSPTFEPDPKRISELLAERNDRFAGLPPEQRAETAAMLAALFGRVNKHAPNPVQQKALVLFQFAQALREKAYELRDSCKGSIGQVFGSLRQAELALSKAIKLLDEHVDETLVGGDSLLQKFDRDTNCSFADPDVLETAVSAMLVQCEILPFRTDLIYHRASYRYEQAFGLKLSADCRNCPDPRMVLLPCLRLLMGARDDFDEFFGTMMELPTFKRVMSNFLHLSTEEVDSYVAEVHLAYANTNALLAAVWVPASKHAEFVSDPSEAEETVKEFRLDAIKHFRIHFQMKPEDPLQLPDLARELFGTMQLKDCLETLEIFRSFPVDKREELGWDGCNNAEFLYGLVKCLLAETVEPTKQGVEIMANCIESSRRKQSDRIFSWSRYHCVRLLSGCLERCAEFLKIAGDTEESRTYSQRAWRNLNWAKIELFAGRGDPEESALEDWTDISVHMSAISRLLDDPGAGLPGLNCIWQQSSNLNRDQLKRISEERCYCFGALNQLSEAQKDAEFLVENYEKDYVGHYLMSQLLAEKKDYKLALRSAEAALELATEEKVRKMCFDNLIDVMSSPVMHDEKAREEMTRVREDNPKAFSEAVRRGDYPRVSEVSDEVSIHLMSVTCAGCGKISSRSLKRCGRCRFSRYCSRECQREDWPKHKKLCPRLKQLNIWLRNEAA